jgi:hypothetical protein
MAGDRVNTPPAFQVLIGDLRTGKITTRVPATAAPWQQVLNAAGMLGASLNVAASDLSGLDLYHAAAPAKAFLAIQYDRTLLAGGPIWGHQYSRAAGTLDLTAAGIWSLFDHRAVIAALSQPVAVGAAQASTTTYASGANMSLGDIAAALITQARSHVGGSLPIVMSAAQGLTPGATRTYNGYDLTTVGARLTELTGDAGGPEIRFQPRFKAADPTSIEWVMQVGSPTQPLLVQGGADWYFDASVPASMVSDLSVDISGTAMATRAWVVGAGSQAGVMLSEADSTTLTSVGYPLLETVDRNHTSDATQVHLDGYAWQTLARTSRPATVIKIKVRNDGAPLNGFGGPTLGSYVQGDYAQLIIGADPYLPAGVRRARILQIDGDLGFECTLTLNTIAAEV